MREKAVKIVREGEKKSVHRNKAKHYRSITIQRVICQHPWNIRKENYQRQILYPAKTFQVLKGNGCDME